MSRPGLDVSRLEGHERVACGFSGGKDSLAVVWMLRAAGVLDKVVLYHVDTGDLLPEVRATVDAVRAIAPRFVAVPTDARGWIWANGRPSDLVPHSSHPTGQEMAEGPRLVHRYACCSANLMLPFMDAVRADGCTLLIRGTKRADMRRLPCGDGETVGGSTLWLPLLEWSNADVLAYLRSEGAPIPAGVYEHFENAPECATCTAWWDEGRAAYLRRRHPALYREYAEGMASIMEEVGPVAEKLAAELRELSRVDETDSKHE